MGTRKRVSVRNVRIFFFRRSFINWWYEFISTAFVFLQHTYKSATLAKGGSRHFWKRAGGGGGAASQVYFCPSFGLESGGGFEAIKIAKNDLFGVKKFWSKEGSCNPCNHSTNSANAWWILVYQNRQFSETIFKETGCPAFVLHIALRLWFQLRTKIYRSLVSDILHQQAKWSSGG